MHLSNILTAATAASLSTSLSQRQSSTSDPGLVFEGCTSSEVTTYVEMIENASRCLDTIIRLRESDSPMEKELRVRYFGQSNEVDDEHVTNVIKSISANLTKKPFHCSDKEECTAPKDIHNPPPGTWGAFSQSGEVTYCQWYLDMPPDPSQRDRSIGLIHEMSHAPVNGAAKDLVYGTTTDGREVQILAANYPGVAEGNADNYYFYAQDVCAADRSGVVPPAVDIHDCPPGSVIQNGEFRMVCPL